MNQSKALAILKSGRNAFLTGSAGAGKTYVLNRYIRYLKEHKVPVAVTASTGIAATHMNGQTIHSWSGIGVRDEINAGHLNTMMERKYFRDKMENVKVLIIDEISMLHKLQLDMVDRVLRHFKENVSPFGGIQVVFSGDFFQLPPIGSDNETSREKFAFMSEAWLSANPAICYLTEQHRQHENLLNTILNEIRSGSVTQNSIEELRARIAHRFDETDETKLFTHNADVDRLNQRHLSGIATPSQHFKAELTGKEALIAVLKKSVLAPEVLELKIGARVMFIRNNFEKGYVNGTLGTVTGFSDDGFPTVRTRDLDAIEAKPETWAIENEAGKPLASFTQIPLRLAWVITVHKSQGMTLDAAVIDLSHAFERGQGYVALSRLRDLEGMKLLGFNQTALEVDSLAQKADIRFRVLSQEADQELDETKLERSFKPFIQQCGGITDKNVIARSKEKLSRKIKPEKGGTYKITLGYVEQRLSIEEIAKKRGLTKGTILHHFTHIVEMFPETDFEIYRPAADLIEKVRNAAADQSQSENLSLGRIYSNLNEEVSYEEIRLVLLFIKDRVRQS